MQDDAVPLREDANHDDDDEQRAVKAARMDNHHHHHDDGASNYTASLHAATSALFRPGNNSSSNVLPAAPVSVPSTRPAAAPIAFVPATKVNVSAVAKAVVPAAAEDDAFAQFFNEINEL